MKSKFNAMQPVQPIAELDATELAAVQGGFIIPALSPIGDRIANFQLPEGLANSYAVQAFREQGLMQGLQPQEQGPTMRGFGGQRPFVTDPLPELV